MRRHLWKLEAAATAFERALIVALLAVMAGAVFLDALHRVFAAGEGRFERLLLLLTPAAAAPAVRAAVAPALLLLFTFVVFHGALRTRTPDRTRGRTALLAAGATLALAAVVQLIVRAVPSGFVWSQQMALCFLLWVALAGASLGARDHTHITFELAGKIWPARLRRPAELTARVVAAAFTLFLAVLAAAHAREHYLEWATSGGTAGLFEAFRVPRWTIFGFLPVPFTILALRFLAFGVQRPEPAPPGVPEEPAP